MLTNWYNIIKKENKMKLETAKTIFATLGLTVLATIGSLMLPLHNSQLLIGGFLFFVAFGLLVTNNITDKFGEYHSYIPAVSFILILIGGRFAPLLTLNFLIRSIAGIAILVCTLVIANYLKKHTDILPDSE